MGYEATPRTAPCLVAGAAVAIPDDRYYVCELRSRLDPLLASVPVDRLAVHAVYLALVLP